MIIKAYTDSSSAAALKRIRSEMGGDAIVLNSRQVIGSDNRPAVEITACLENPTVAQSALLLEPDNARPIEEPRPAPEKRSVRSQNRLSTLSTGVSSPDLSHLIDLLRQADFPASVIARVVERVQAQQGANADVEATGRQILVAEVASAMTPVVPFKAGDRVLFVGPAGSGKSSMLGKLAAQLVLTKKQRVTLLTLDNCKMAAFEEVAGYARVIGATIIDFASSLEEPILDPESVTLIDSPALPSDGARLAQLTQQVKAINPTHVFAVYSALTRSDEVPNIARRMESLSPTHLIVTMLDLTHRCGTAIAAAEVSRRKIAFISESPVGTKGLAIPDPDRLVRNLMQTEAALG